MHLSLQVKIQRKQRLVKKDIEPIFSKDDMKNGPTTEGALPFYIYLLFAILYIL